MGVEHSWRMRQKQDSKSLAIQTHSLKSTHPVWDATISGADSIEVNYAKIHASHGGCDGSAVNDPIGFDAKIHASHGGCDCRTPDCWRETAAKIHASHGGCDRKI